MRNYRVTLHHPDFKSQQDCPDKVSNILGIIFLGAKLPGRCKWSQSVQVPAACGCDLCGARLEMARTQDEQRCSPRQSTQHVTSSPSCVLAAALRAWSHCGPISLKPGLGEGLPFRERENGMECGSADPRAPAFPAQG